MGKHVKSTDDQLVVSFASAILTMQSEPIGMAFRFITDSKKEFVIHVFSNILVEHIDFISSLMSYRDKTLSDDELKKCIESFSVHKLAFSKLLPTIRDSDFNCNDSIAVIKITYEIRIDGIKMNLTHTDKSTRSFIISDYLAFKTLDYAKRLLSMIKSPRAGHDKSFH